MVETQTEEGIVSIDEIRDFILGNLRDYFGRHDIDALEPLFRNLSEGLKITTGKLDTNWESLFDEKFTKYGLSKKTGVLNEPTALLISDVLPADSDIFALCPNIFNKDKSLRLLEVLPRVEPRDLEERIVLGRINEVLRKKVEGKQASCKGELIVPKYGSGFGEASYDVRTTVRKILQLPLQIPFDFFADVSDLRIGPALYHKFLDYQRGRNIQFRKTADDLVESASKKY